tara:strand:+ start:494 stop:655 length:162 start_codon:yes stop_codon:yes gene_type:complete
MFKHVAMMFDYVELPSMINQYEKLQSEGRLNEAAVIRKNIANILRNEPSGESS